MLAFFISSAIEFILFITILTQVLIPIFVPELKFFWLFKDKKRSTKK